MKAFDRCDRTLLWAVMESLGVPPTVLLVLRALHEKVDVKFNVDGVELGQGTPLLFQLLGDFGLEAHSRPPPGPGRQRSRRHQWSFWRRLGPATRTTVSWCCAVLEAVLTCETWTWVVDGPYTWRRARSVLGEPTEVGGGASSHGGT